MSAAKHTPGPWHVRPAICRNDHPDTSADVHGRDGQFVADCGCHEQATPNATLIAAAPALAGSVTELLAELSCIGDGPLRYDKCLRGLAGQPCPPCAKAIRAAAALRAAGRLP